MNISKLSEKRKMAILNAALKEFTTKGYDEASTNVIAKEAQISKALMFHYVKNKQELFLFVYDYFESILEKEYVAKINLQEKDLFNRLRQSCLLQIALLKQYPWILEFDKLSAETGSETINKRIKKSNSKKNLVTCSQLFDGIDTVLFRNNLDVEKCKQLILWATSGFTNQILDNSRNQKGNSLKDKQIIATLDGYFNELRNIFYASCEKEER